jgi:acyl-CoA dehydrogenase
MDKIGQVPDRYLSEEQRLMRQTCGRYVDAVVRPFIAANREREWLFDPDQRLPAEILAEADRAGLRGLGVPDRYGGVGLDPAAEAQTFSIIATELARGDSGLADKLVQNWKISVLLRSLAPPHLQDTWFQRYMADPQFLMAHCLTEPRGASDRWLYANTNRSAGMLQGTSSFLVPRDTPGLQVTRCNETVGGRFMNNGEILFEDCRVPEDHLLADGDALAQAGVYFRPGKIIQAAKNLGIGIAAFDDTAAFVQQRVQGGRILIKHQAVAVRVAAMATKLEAVSALLRSAALAVDENHPDATRLCDMVKVFASQEILQVCQHAVELHGGYGAMLEVGVEKYFRDAAVYLHMDATVDVSNFKIAKALFPATAGAYAGPE